MLAVLWVAAIIVDCSFRLADQPSELSRKVWDGPAKNTRVRSPKRRSVGLSRRSDVTRRYGQSAPM
jgi:hypothetical protein